MFNISIHDLPTTRCRRIQTFTNGVQDQKSASDFQTRNWFVRSLWVPLNMHIQMLRELSSCQTSEEQVDKGFNHIPWRWYMFAHPVVQKCMMFVCGPASSDIWNPGEHGEHQNSWQWDFHHPQICIKYASNMHQICIIGVDPSPRTGSLGDQFRWHPAPAPSWPPIATHQHRECVPPEPRTASGMSFLVSHRIKCLPFLSLQRKAWHLRGNRKSK